MNATVISAIVRHLLTSIGGALAFKYGIDGDSVEALASAGATIAGVAWSLHDKRKRW